MKKLFCILLVYLLISCDNSLDINDEWRDIPVIYGILDPGTNEPNLELGINENHYVRVQKSFLGPQSANNYVNIYDSIYYNESDLNVWLDIINDEGEVDGPYFLEFISHDNLEEIELSKEDGLFHSENHHLYKIPYVARNLTNAAEDDDVYRINVLNINTGDTAFSETNIVEPITMSRPQPTGPQSFLFASVSSQATSTQPIEILNSKNAKTYSVKLRFNYLEQHKDDYLLDISDGIIDQTNAVLKYIELNLDDIEPTSSTSVDTYISPGNFLEFLATQIASGDDYYIYPYGTYNSGNAVHPSLDLLVTAINAELDTYINANAPTYGFNQERPEYNNIINGIGHWSSRSVLNMEGLKLTNNTMNFISSELAASGLNFACYNTDSQGELDFNGYYLQFGEDCVND